MQNYLYILETEVYIRHCVGLKYGVRRNKSIEKTIKLY